VAREERQGNKVFRVLLDLEDQLEKLDPLVLMGLLGSEAKLVKEELLAQLGHLVHLVSLVIQDSQDRLVQLAPLDLEVQLVPLVIKVRKALKDQLVQMVELERLALMDKLDSKGLRAREETLEQLAWLGQLVRQVQQVLVAPQVSPGQLEIQVQLDHPDNQDPKVNLELREIQEQLEQLVLLETKERGVQQERGASQDRLVNLGPREHKVQLVQLESKVHKVPVVRLVRLVLQVILFHLNLCLHTSYGDYLRVHTVPGCYNMYSIQAHAHDDLLTNTRADKVSFSCTGPYVSFKHYQFNSHKESTCKAQYMYIEWF
jgi:hypothetical protein